MDLEKVIIIATFLGAAVISLTVLTVSFVIYKRMKMTSTLKIPAAPPQNNEETAKKSPETDKVL